MRARIGAPAMLVALATGCGGPPPDPAVATPTERPFVAAVAYPLAFFAERIGGDAVAVRFPVPAGVDPAFWRPDDAALLAYQRADRVLLSGGYARWVDAAVLPRAALVDTAAGLDLPAGAREPATHSHGPGGAHSHHRASGAIWLDPALAAGQARRVWRTLVDLVPGHAEALADRHDELQRELAGLGERLDAWTDRYDGQPLLASHPVYDALARRCRWNLRSLHWEPDAMPDEAAWRELDELRGRFPAAWMIWEDEPLPAIAERLAARGIDVVVVRPCGNRPPSGELLAEMRANVERLEAIVADVAR